jgi:release factor glutamine methyltransferase
MSKGINNIKECTEYFTDQLSGIYPIKEIRSMVYLMLEDLLSISRSELLTNLQRSLDASITCKINDIVSDLKKEKPIQYILGKSDFYGCKILVNPDVLIPRPETEELVHWIIQETAGKKVSIMDIATGSGCIAIALAKNLDTSIVVATDRSECSLATAKKSARLNNQNISFIKHDLISPEPADDLPVVDIIVSNPPYVCEHEKQQMRRNVLTYEPHEALFVPDDDPLIFYRAILTIAKTKLIPGKGLIYFEINERMGNEVPNLLKKHQFNAIELKQDLNGKERMVKARFANDV